MAFRRETARSIAPSPDELTARMTAIGMAFATEPDVDANIEDTLVHASGIGMDGGDLRVLSVLTTWFGVHHAHVNADALIRMVAAHPSQRVHAYWAAIAAWCAKDRRFARLATGYRGPAHDLLPVGTDFQLTRRGADPRFAGSVLRVPNGTLRDREDDVLSPEVLVRRHAGYRNRIRMGPTWRADVWTVLEQSPDLSIAEVARRVSCSFATAWQVAQDFRLLQRARASR